MSSLFTKNDIDNLKLACVKWEQETGLDVVETIFKMMYQLDLEEENPINLNDMNKAFELLFDPLKVLRAFSSIFRQFLHFGKNEQLMKKSFSTILRVLDYFVEAKNEALEQDCYFLFDPLIGIDFEAGVDIEESFTDEMKLSYCLSLSFMSKKEQNCEIVALAFDENNLEIDFRVVLEGKNLSLYRNNVFEATLDENCDLKDVLLTFVWNESQATIFCVDGDIRYEEMRSTHYPSPRRLTNLSLIRNFSGRLNSIFGFPNTHLQTCVSLVQQVVKDKFGLADAEFLKRICSQNKLNFQLLSKRHQIGIRLASRANFSKWVYMGKTDDERNLSISPGLIPLIPFFAYLSNIDF